MSATYRGPLDAECVAVLGRRGTGKTTLTMRLVGGHRRVVVYDPMDQWPKPPVRFSRCASLDAVRNALVANWRTGFRIAYVPSGDHPRMLHGLNELLWAAQERAKAKVMLVVEEMSLSYPVHNIPARLLGMGRAVLQGRHRGIEIIGTTQWPSLISLGYRMNCAETYVFPLGAGADVDALRKVAGPEHIDAIKRLKAHTYLRFRDGEVTGGRNTRHRK